jgi:hypothetical protein
MEVLCQSVDVLLTPSTPAPAPKSLASTGDPSFNGPASFSGHPSLNLPSGLSADGLPFGIQLMSATLREDRLIAAGQWCEAVLGRTFNSIAGWERNNFDRLVHFAYGLLLAYPIREVFLRVADVRGFWGYFLPLDLTMSTSMIFELLEWAAAAVFGGDLGQAYLGTQGDVWDSHKDMALASAGALIAMGLNAVINWRLQRDFAREWLESLRVKHPAPLGEEEIVRMTRE